MVIFRYSTILGLFSFIAGIALGYGGSNSEVVFKCAQIPSPVCYLRSVTFEDATASLTLNSVDGKEMLHIKGGKIEALQPKHCESLSKFQKVQIGRVGLKELCFTTSFVHVNAEHNRLKKLHVEALPADGATYRMEELHLNDNQLETIDGICNFVALKELHLEQNLLSSLDMRCFADMKQLKKLHLASNRLNMITTTTNGLALPALSFMGLQNNTLTELDLHKWSLPALEVLELSSNNLTNVRGLTVLQMLSDISLAGNRWHCDELEQMLEGLESNGVHVKDGDHNCSGIRNGTICCTYEHLSSEGTLLDELKQFSDLKQRYEQVEHKLDEMVRKEIEKFESKIMELKETFAKRDEVPDTTEPPSAEEGNDLEEPKADSNDPHSESAPNAKCECLCSKDNVDALQLKLTKLQKDIEANNKTLQALRDNQSQVSYMALLTKHEFRTAVKRGEYKLKELSSMLSMLREHIKHKQTQH
ncbi:uncharacterized protein LOC126562196 [Anopheles maculipalpis]|uniref:uncharacterized protein LOC126562196 n=1 Tax=Anopheles maculipalpis TaxID=1496333 RepID=UPI002159AD17|nr:uncharacterized protein LOC126562196 [Anopheles maculipalpis]